jgi:hypothetical protein
MTFAQLAKYADREATEPDPEIRAVEALRLIAALARKLALLEGAK